MLLAELGAEAIKVEPRSGDALPSRPPITDQDKTGSGFSENFASLNRNKPSIVLDLKEPKDRTIARGPINNTVVVIENNRPGAMRRLGLNYDVVGLTRPGLIYCSISAFGQEGPRSTEGGFDVTIKAKAGMMSATGERGGNPVKCGLPAPGFVAGFYGALSVSSVVALVRASRSEGTSTCRRREIAWRLPPYRQANI